MHNIVPLRVKTILQISLFFILVCFNLAASAHGDEIEVGGGSKGPVQLTDEQARMLQITTAEASTQHLAQILSLNGQIKLLPNEQADVSVRISGSITAIDANLGDATTVGKKLATIQSRLIGDPPPSVAVYAPMAGVIDARNVNVGQAVEPNTVLFHISNREKMLVVAVVYEEDVGKVKLGQDVNVHVLSYPKEVFTGKVTLIEPNFDSLTRTVNVQIILTNKENLLKPGMFVRANLVLNKADGVLSIPNSALIEANGEQFVFVRNGKSYDRIDVRLGASDDDYTEITDGLVPGDEVVTQGNRELYTLWLTGTQSKATKEGHH
jgi:multidrug efflux pump subunit AcrA (membrane-fusion protein)